jgi:acetoin utilization deacetylase AcuC-like enzyme
VFTFSNHEEDTYPFVKPPSDIEVGLRSGAADDEYLTQLNAGMERAWSKAKPDLVVYVAGADTYAFDQLGGLSLTITGMKERDEMVFGKSRQTGIPVVSVLAGGYAADVADLITIHANTALVMQEMLGG